MLLSPGGAFGEEASRALQSVSRGLGRMASRSGPTCSPFFLKVPHCGLLEVRQADLVERGHTGQLVSLDGKGRPDP